MAKVSNNKVRGLVQSCKEFRANNLFAELVDGIYTVYSYGHHFPIYACIKGEWYKNKDRYSVSTSKHQSQAHPLCNVHEAGTQELKKLINI